MIFRMILEMFNIKEEDINKDSIGYKKWIWFDKGEIKFSAKILARFGPILAGLIFLSVPGTISFISGKHEWIQIISLSYISLWFILLPIIIFYNRFARKRNEKKNY